jgi:hypothetical protein
MATNHSLWGIIRQFPSPSALRPAYRCLRFSSQPIHHAENEPKKPMSLSNLVEKEVKATPLSSLPTFGTVFISSSRKMHCYQFSEIALHSSRLSMGKIL